MNRSSNAPNVCGLLRLVHWTTGCLAVVVLVSVLSASARADGLPPLPDYKDQSWGPRADVRHDGVLAESYAYHRSGEKGDRHLLPERPEGYFVQKVPVPFFGAPPHGPYRYGFPVKTYRWGWFGAEHYYPYVVWHRGYNGDCVRWGYRRGY